MSIRLLLLTCVLAGAGVGTAVALADDPAPRSATPPAAAPPARGDALSPIPARNVRIAARIADPEGAAPWAVRTFDSVQRGRAVRCEQLGRLRGGDFGWIPPGRRFVRARFALDSVPTSCGGATERSGEFARGPRLQRVSLLTDAADGRASVARSVVFGRVADDVLSVELDEGERVPVRGAGVVLSVRTKGPLDPAVRGVQRRADGSRDAFGSTGERTPLPARGGDPAIGSTVRVAATAPDPAGGPAWAVLAGFDEAGNVCRSPAGRLVGDQFATLRPDLGTATPALLAAEPVCRREGTPTADRPVRVDVGGYATSEEDPVGSSSGASRTGPCSQPRPPTRSPR